MDPQKPESIVVIGPGRFGQAMGHVLTLANYNVTFGTRRPDESRPTDNKSLTTSIPRKTIEEAIDCGSIIILAIPSEAHEDLLQFKSKLASKILVDVSNPKTWGSKSTSVAEELQAMFPESYVVKAFNTLSAFALTSSFASGSLQVHVAGDDVAARDRVISMSRDIGARCQSYGGLKYARQLEKMPRKLFHGWGMPLLVTLTVFAVWYIYGNIRFHYIVGRELERMPLNTFNKILGCSSITNLSLCFLPGPLAVLFRLCSKRFSNSPPHWLLMWLKMRKQLGLFALYFASVHCIISAIYTAPGYLKIFYQFDYVHIKGNLTDDIKLAISPRLTWFGEGLFLFGTLSLSLMVVLGVTTIPSVSASMNWRQWAFVQSKVGFICLLFAFIHVLFKGTPKWAKQSPVLTIQRLSFLSLIPSGLAILMRLIAMLASCSVSLRDKFKKGEANSRQGKSQENTQVV